MSTLLSLYREQAAHEHPQDFLTVIDMRQNAVHAGFPALDRESSAAASCLRNAGCGKGGRVLISVKDTRALFAFFWGALKLGAVPCVLFPETGAAGLTVRMKAAEASFFVTDTDPEKICFEKPASLKQIIFLRNINLNEIEPTAEFADVTEDDPAFMVFTSGSTGLPKPVLHRYGIADAVSRSMRNVLRASANDRFWCTAHPAWITGTVYGLIGPLVCGIPSLQYEGAFHARRWLPILQDQHVTLWYTAPTALRGLMREADSFFAEFDLSALKQIYSIGEPLAPAVYAWGKRVFGQPIYDTWFQTEAGTIRIANQPGDVILPGTMGRAVDDTEAVITADGGLCLKAGFGSQFIAYYGMPEKTAEKLHGGLLVSGDLASMDAEGRVRFEGRADDVINTAGHLVGPEEVEQVLESDPAVRAAAVVSEPDAMLYEHPAAFVVLEDGIEWNRTLESRLRVSVNRSVSVYAVPKRFIPVLSLPYTGSGKLNRSVLRTELREGMNSDLGSGFASGCDKIIR